MADFKKEFGLDRKRFTSWQRFMHHFEKQRNLRLAVVLGIGAVAVTNVLTLIPGTRYMFQREAKEATARGFLKFAYLSNIHSEAVAMDTPGEWLAGVKTAGYYVKRFRSERMINPVLIATEIDLLTNAVQRSSKDLSLLYSSFDVLNEALEWVLQDYPKLFRNKDLYDAISACFNAIVAAAQVPDHLAQTAGVTLEEQGNWAGFVTLILVLYRFRQDTSAHVLLLQGLETVATQRPWMYRLESTDLMEVLFRNTHSEEQALRATSLRLLLTATRAGAPQYLSNRLLSNLITHVLPTHPDILPTLDQLITAAQSFDWSSAPFSEERSRLKALDPSQLPAVLRDRLKALVET